MTHYRSEYRKVVREALQVEPALGGYTYLSAWAQKIDPSQLPVFGVATPNEASSRQGGDTVHRITTLQIAARFRGGDDIEDDLDDLSLAIEAAVLTALDPVSHIAELSRTSASPDAGGEQRSGTLLMEFTITRFTDAGSGT